MALPTGKPLLHLLLHPIILQCLRKLTEYPFTGRLILNTINGGRKLHFLVFIIDKKDSLIYRAQRKGPSVCPDLRGGSGKQGTCPSVWLCVYQSVGQIPHSSDWNWVLAPSDSNPLCPWAEGIKPHIQKSRPVVETATSCSLSPCRISEIWEVCTHISDVIL